MKPRLVEPEQERHFYEGRNPHEEQLIRTVEADINTKFALRHSDDREAYAAMAMDCFMLGLRLGGSLDGISGYGSFMYDCEFKLLNHLQHIYEQSKV